MMIDTNRYARLRTVAALVLALLLCAPSLASCAKDDGEKEPLSDIPVTAYTIVRGDSSGSAVLRSVVELKEAIKKQYGTEPVSTTDWQVDAESENATAFRAEHEILVGLTNRRESIEAFAELEGKYGYIIRSAGNNIVITASSVNLLNEAVKQFIEKELKSAKKGFLRSKIEFKCLLSPNLLLDGDTPTLNIAYPENASLYLRKQIAGFAEMIRLLGVEPAVSEEHSPAGSLQIGFHGKLPAETLNGPAVSAFSVSYKNASLVLEASNDDLFSAALATLYEYLEEHYDETLDGTPLLYCLDGFSIEDNWALSIPRVIGGTYITTDDANLLATGSAQVYYENVSQTAIDLYISLLTGALNYTPSPNKSAWPRNYVSTDRRSISLRYDSGKKTLTIIVGAPV